MKACPPTGTIFNFQEVKTKISQLDGITNADLPLLRFQFNNTKHTLQVYRNQDNQIVYYLDGEEGKTAPWKGFKKNVFQA